MAKKANFTVSNRIVDYSRDGKSRYSLNIRIPTFRYYSSVFSISIVCSSKYTEEMRNSSSSSTFKITDELKSFIDTLVDTNKTNGAIAVGLIDSNGAQSNGHGKISSNSSTTVDENTIFAIGSITKVFTTTLLAGMVNQGLVKLDDPIEKYLPSDIKISQYKKHKITIEDLATHTSGLPYFPSNYCSFFDTHPQHIKTQLNIEKI